MLVATFVISPLSTMTCPSESLIHITAPHFVAGVVVASGPNGVVIEAAPIVEYMKGSATEKPWSRNRVLLYCDQKGWKVQ